MAKFTVHVTFEVPAQRVPLRVTHRLTGRAASMRWLAGDGMLAVTAVRVGAESPADAAMIVVKAVTQRWVKARGPITMRSWQAHQERVLVGGRRSSGSGTGGAAWDDDSGPDDEDGSAGVREPRRPLPGPGSLHAEREPDPASGTVV